MALLFPPQLSEESSARKAGGAEAAAVTGYFFINALFFCFLFLLFKKKKKNFGDRRAGLWGASTLHRLCPGSEGFFSFLTLLLVSVCVSDFAFNLL